MMNDAFVKNSSFIIHHSSFIIQTKGLSLQSYDENLFSNKK
jgi:hypothetical protein